MIQEREDFWVLDSTKIQEYMQCPRRYFFKFIVGWQPELPSVHLEYGIAVHKALEILLLGGGFDTAFEAFETSFRDRYVSICGDEHKNKNIATTYYTLLQYSEFYKNDLQHFKVLHTEVAGSILIDVNKKLYFRTDTLAEGNIMEQNGFFSLEHKTGTSLDRKWKDQWRQKFQVGVYTHVVNCMYPTNEALGVVINGFFPHNPPEMKRDGTPKANSKDAEFFRMLVRRTPRRMEDWILGAISWYDSVIKDTEAVLQVSEDQPVMTCFRKNTESCTDFFGCPFQDYCEAWSNPTRNTAAQTGFVERYWDPRAVEKKEEVNL